MSLLVQFVTPLWKAAYPPTWIVFSWVSVESWCQITSNLTCMYVWICQISVKTTTLCANTSTLTDLIWWRPLQSEELVSSTVRKHWLHDIINHLMCNSILRGGEEAVSSNLACIHCSHQSQMLLLFFSHKPAILVTATGFNSVWCFLPYLTSSLWSNCCFSGFYINKNTFKTSSGCTSLNLISKMNIIF